MKRLILSLLALLLISGLPLSFANEIASALPVSEVLTRSANGLAIPDPISTSAYLLRIGPDEISVPQGMVYVPAARFTVGLGDEAQEVDLEAFCIGRFEVTNAEWQRFLDATGRRAPRYWKEGRYPDGKANHPVLFISLNEAEAYCAWVSEATGWPIVIPSANQWEAAARDPLGGRYPWGDEREVRYEDGKLHSRFNYNAVCAAHFLAEGETMTNYSERSSRAGEAVRIKDIRNGRGEPFAITPQGGVNAWIDHGTQTAFAGTQLYADLVAEGGFTTPVGSFEKGISWCGAYDMAGNAYEWTSTLIIATNGAERGKEVNEIRGGSWYSTGQSCVSVSTGEGRAAGGGFHSVGFRIALSPLLPTP